MKVKLLREALLTIAENEQAVALKELAKLFQPLDTLEVSALLKVLAPALKKSADAETKRQQKAKDAEAKQRQADAAAVAAVSQYIEELEATKADNTAFEQVVKRIETDRAIKPSHAEQIAHRFMSNTASYATKKAATKAILKRQISDKRAAQRSSQVSGLF
jgi:hemoglobin-like flavoprotein